MYLTITNRKYNTWCKYNKRLDTYGSGCAHDCKYCYARALLNFRGNWNIHNPKFTYIDEIEKSICGLEKYDVVRMGGMTDCFQTTEAYKHITYNAIKILNRYRINYIITTKSSLVADDDYIKVYNKDFAHFQISVPCTDENEISKIEKCDSFHKRICAIEKLYNMGFDVSIRLSPFLYQYTDKNILNKIKCNKILIEFLKVNYWIKRNFNYDYQFHTFNYGGYQNLQLEYKISIIKNFIYNFDQCSVGEFVKSHHEYFSANYNYNINDCCNINIKNNKTKECEQTRLNF